MDNSDMIKKIMNDFMTFNKLASVLDEIPDSQIKTLEDRMHKLSKISNIFESLKYTLDWITRNQMLIKELPTIKNFVEAHYKDLRQVNKIIGLIIEGKEYD